jgi:hypothetical protein
MAKSTTRTGKVEKKISAKSTKTTEVEVVDQRSGLGFDGGVAIICFALLLVAFLLVDHELGAAGGGIFFKK